MNELQKFIQSKPFGFVTEAELPHIIKLDRLFPLLVRCGNGRFTAPAQDLAHFIQAITAAGDYVRDVSFPVGSIERAADWQPERISAILAPPCQAEGEDPNPIDDSVKVCPDCERPNQFGETCASCQHDRQVEIEESKFFDESQCGGVFDGSRVISDADPGL